MIRPKETGEEAARVPSCGKETGGVVPRGNKPETEKEIG